MGTRLPCLFLSSLPLICLFSSLLFSLYLFFTTETSMEGRKEGGGRGRILGGGGCRGHTHLPPMEGEEADREEHVFSSHLTLPLSSLTSHPHPLTSFPYLLSEIFRSPSGFLTGGGGRGKGEQTPPLLSSLPLRGRGR